MTPEKTFTFEEWAKEAPAGTIFFSVQCQTHSRHCPLAMLDPSQLEGMARHGCETLRGLAEQATHGTVFDRPENRRFIRQFFRAHKRCRMVVGPAQTSSVLDVKPEPEISS